jgi:hypothetical protein
VRKVFFARASVGVHAGWTSRPVAPRDTSVPRGMMALRASPRVRDARARTGSGASRLLGASRSVPPCTARTVRRLPVRGARIVPSTCTRGARERPGWNACVTVARLIPPAPRGLPASCTSATPRVTRRSPRLADRASPVHAGSPRSACRAPPYAGADELTATRVPCTTGRCGGWSHPGHGWRGSPAVARPWRSSTSRLAPATDGRISG